ncbi:CPBP family intramembrane glutamic endopeptidase [Priestia megaterium]|uniref:CPBP family intramembrane glutamic endopeptidase n=1 Tax=Priestia megaterium TaxID=1404 RepID=UPI0030C97C82
MSFKTRILFLSPFLLYLLIILIGNKGVHGSSIVDLVLILLTQTLVIAFVEEMVFRGFILNLLLAKSYKVTVLLSSFLFAFTHSLNMLSGQSVANTIFQILFAFVIGLVLALLIVNGQSIGVTIVFHGLNNFLQFTSPVEANDSLLINYTLLLFLSGYALYLWNRKSTLSVSHHQVSG